MSLVPCFAPYSLLFIDPTVGSYEGLMVAAEPAVQIIVLDPSRDGVHQVLRALQANPDVKNVYILASGAPGCLYLGNSELSLRTLSNYTEALHTAIGQRQFNLHLYGCNVAAGDAGAELIEKLEYLTGAYITASQTLIGDAALIGSWELDYNSGTMTPTELKPTNPRQ
jgi:hypothetical protein